MSRIDWSRAKKSRPTWHDRHDPAAGLDLQTVIAAISVKGDIPFLMKMRDQCLRGRSLSEPQMRAVQRIAES